MLEGGEAAKALNLQLVLPSSQTKTSISKRPSVLHPCPAQEIIRLPYSVKHSETALELARDGKGSRFLVMWALEEIQLQVLLLRMPSMATSQMNSSPSQM